MFGFGLPGCVRAWQPAGLPACLRAFVRACLPACLPARLVASLPALANVGLATSFYTLIQAHALWAQLAGIVVVYVWNYAASSRFVWNSP